MDRLTFQFLICSSKVRLFLTFSSIVFSCSFKINIDFYGKKKKNKKSRKHCLFLDNRLYIFAIKLEEYILIFLDSTKLKIVWRKITFSKRCASIILWSFSQYDWNASFKKCCYFFTNNILWETCIYRPKT